MLRGRRLTRGIYGRLQSGNSRLALGSFIAAARDVSFMSKTASQRIFAKGMLVFVPMPDRLVHCVTALFSSLGFMRGGSTLFWPMSRFTVRTRLTGPLLISKTPSISFDCEQVKCLASETNEFPTVNERLTIGLDITNFCFRQ